MEDIKLVFFDVDGTLLDRQGRYSKQLAEKVKDLKAAGVKLAIASGRPPFACQFLFEQLGIDDTGLFYTGGLIYQPKTGLTLQSSTLQPLLAKRIIDRAKQLNLYCELYLEQEFVLERPHFIASEHSRHLRCEPRFENFGPVLADPNAHIHKLLVGEDIHESNNVSELEQEFPQCQFAYASLPSQPDWRFASVVPAQADKHLAFDQLLAHHGLISEQVMAIGDSQSDQIFVERAGVGVAMANAIPELQQVANLVTADAENNGAYKALCTVFG